MGEIKSTLDLVMERTSHLTLSGEEKAEQNIKAFNKSLTGLLRKYQESLIKAEEFRRSFESLRETHGVEDDDAAVKAITDEIGLDEDNERLLVLLDAVCGVSGESLVTVIDEYRTTLGHRAEQRRREVVQNLEKTRGISGSAVIPNLARDGAWIEESRVMKEKFDQMLEREKAGLSA